MDSRSSKEKKDIFQDSNLHNEIENIHHKIQGVNRGIGHIYREIQELNYKMGKHPIDNERENKERYDVYNRLGLKLLLDSRSLVDKCLIEQGFWEEGQISFMENMMEYIQQFDKTMFLDIGAYFGLYSLIAFKKGIFSKIIAFEAERTNHAQLQGNLFLNNASNSIKVINKAVSDKVGTAKFYNSMAHPDGNRGGVGICDSGAPTLLPEKGRDSAYAVDTLPIDSVLKEKGYYILAKLDVEGHELQALSGMKELIKNNKIIIQVEAFDYQRAAILSAMKEFDLFEFCEIGPDYYFTNIPLDEIKNYSK